MYKILRKKHKLNVKIRSFLSLKGYKKMKRQLTNGGKILQIMYLIGDWYPEYTKNSYNKKPTQFKNG